MRLHILVRKGVLGFALPLAGLVVSTAAAQAQDKEPAKDAAKAEKQVKRQCRKKNTKQANKTHKPKICPFCVLSVFSFLPVNSLHSSQAASVAILPSALLVVRFSLGAWWVFPIQRVLENDFVVVTGTGTARDFIRLLTVELH